MLLGVVDGAYFSPFPMAYRGEGKEMSFPKRPMSRHEYASIEKEQMHPASFSGG